MKKVIAVFILLLAITTVSNAQSLIPFKPTLQVMVKGSYGVPTGHPDFKDNAKSFPGVQLELAYDVSSTWGIYGNFSADFIDSKNSPIPNTTAATSKQYIGYVGPRYYILLPANPLMKLYADAGVGIYNASIGDVTANTGNASLTNISSITQTGVNLGFGGNFTAGTNMFITAGIKYHYIIKKDNETISATLNNNGTSTTLSGTTNIPERSYIQFALGLGFKF